MDILPGNPSFVYIENLTKKPIDLQKFMTVTYASSDPTCIIHARYDEQRMLTDEGKIQTQCDKCHSGPTINAGRYKLPKRCDDWVHRCNAVKKSDEVLKTNWREDLTPLDEYSGYSEKFINLLTQFESMWYRHRGSIKVLHQVDIEMMDKRPKHSAPYHAGPNARDFKKQEINRMFAMDVIEPAHTECALLMLFVLKKDGTSPLRWLS